MTGPYNFHIKMAILNCPTRCHFSIKFAALGSLRVRLRVTTHEGSLGLVLGLASSIVQYFRAIAYYSWFSWRHLPRQKHHAYIYTHTNVQGKHSTSSRQL